MVIIAFAVAVIGFRFRFIVELLQAVQMRHCSRCTIARAIGVDFVQITQRAIVLLRYLQRSGG